MLFDLLDLPPTRHDVEPLSDHSEDSLSSTRTCPIREYRVRKLQCVFPVKEKRTELTENEKHWWTKKEPGFLSVDQGIPGETGTPSSTDDCADGSVQEMGKTVQVHAIERQRLKSGSEKRPEQQRKSKGLTPACPSSTLTNGNRKWHELEIWDCETAVSARPKSQTITTGAHRAQPKRSYSSNHGIQSNRSSPFYCPFISGTPPGSSESESSETSARSNVEVKSRGNLTASSKPSKSRPEFSLANPEVNVFLPEAWDVYNLESCDCSNLTRTPPESSDDEERSESPSLPEHEGTQLLSNNWPQKSFPAKMIDTHRKSHRIRSEGVEIGNYFSKKAGRKKRNKRRKQRQTKKKDMMSLRFNPKKRQQQKKPNFLSCITKSPPKDNFKETNGSNTAEPVQSMVEKLTETLVSVSITERQHQNIPLNRKKGGLILKGPSEEPIIELKKNGKRNWKGRKKKKKKRLQKRRPPKKVKF